MQHAAAKVWVPGRTSNGCNTKDHPPPIPEKAKLTKIYQGSFPNQNCTTKSLSLSVFCSRDHCQEPVCCLQVRGENGIAVEGVCWVLTAYCTLL
eukprot:3564025-Amphidinium_carterae.1